MDAAYEIGFDPSADTSATRCYSALRAQRPVGIGLYSLGKGEAVWVRLTSGIPLAAPTAT